MIQFKPFQAIVPHPDYVEAVAALPYDVYSSAEAKAHVQQQPYRFLRIDRGEINFAETVDPRDQKSYQKASELFQQWLDEQILIENEKSSFYIYEITTATHQQSGLVGLTAVADMLSGKIKDHERTRDDKLADRTNHIKALQAHTGPILMFAQDHVHFDDEIERMKTSAQLLYDFTGVDNNRHKVYQVLDDHDAQLIQAFTDQLDALYIADGHHRAKAAKNVALEKANGGPLDDSDPINYFLSVLFVSQQLHILEYNRVVKDTNNLTPSTFLSLVSEHFRSINKQQDPLTPTSKGECSMYLDGMWYHLQFKHRNSLLNKPMERLDVSILQNYILDPILNIKDPATDQRIGFVGGIKGLDGLVKRIERDAKVAFAFVATSMEELMTISDMGQLMPPKSTWFEPKLLSGLFIHRF